MWGDVGRCGEMWGDMRHACAARSPVQVRDDARLQRDDDSRGAAAAADTAGPYLAISRHSRQISPISRRTQWGRSRALRPHPPLSSQGLYGAGGTSSHPWGAAPLAGVASGVVGVSQTSPGFATFSVRPRLARLTHATLRVPTLHGFIDVHATPNETRVAPPCGTTATVCVRDGSAPRRLLLDGSPAAAQVADGRHRCAVGVGCGAGGRARRVSLE